MICAQQNRMIEINLSSAGSRGAPFNEITVDVIFRDPAGNERQAPAFWARGNDWKVRYASPAAGDGLWPIPKKRTMEDMVLVL